MVPGKKILHILGSFEIGGAESIVRDTILFSSEQELINSYYVIAFKDGKLFNKLNRNNKNIILFETKNLYKRALFLYQFIKRKKINVIHAHAGLSVIIAYLTKMLCRAQEIIIVRTYHGIEQPNTIKKKILFFLASYFSCVNHVFVSNYTQDYYLNRYKYLENRHNKVIYNGINFQKYNDISEETLFKRKSEMFGGMMANFSSYNKDFDTVLKALLVVISKNRNIHFFFLGAKSIKHPDIYENSYRFCQVNNLLSNIHFLGQIEKVQDVLKKFDFYIQSSFVETFGMALTEAMYFQIPVFATKIPPFLEITDNGSNAIIFETANVPDLISKLEVFIYSKNRDNFAIKVNSAYNFVISNFGIEHHIKSLEYFYSSS